MSSDQRLLEHASYEAASAGFRWCIPSFFNIATAVCDAWAQRDPERRAIIEWGATGKTRSWSFSELRSRSNQLAHLLATQAVGPGDRVAILLPQGFETALAHLATFKLGAISVPLFTQFGTSALRHRLNDSGACVLITDAARRGAIESIRDTLPHLRRVLYVDDVDGERVLLEELGNHPPDFTVHNTRADDPAILIYTSGTTGASKGALHAQRVLLGHLPGVEMSHGGVPGPQACMWTPADWAWIGGLLDLLLPALYWGVPVVAFRFPKFDPEAAFALMSDCKVTAAFLPPTALRMMQTVESARRRWPLVLRSIASGGESLSSVTLEWGRRELGITINEFYGQTECNLLVSSCSNWFEPQPGSLGKAVPGHQIALLGPDGSAVPRGTLGQIAVHRPDPVMFLGYWNASAATEGKFRGEWLLTGDMGVADADGFIRFVGRADDVITSAGYRIGPAEIEDCLSRHPAVKIAAVVGVTDAVRTESVAAFIVLQPGLEATPDLGEALQSHVARQLGHYLRPRIIRFVTELPVTMTGKVIRKQLRERLLSDGASG